MITVCMWYTNRHVDKIPTYKKDLHILGAIKGENENNTIKCIIFFTHLNINLGRVKYCRIEYQYETQQ